MGYWKVNTFFSHNKRMRHTVYHFWLSSNLTNCIKYQFRSQVNAIRLLRQSTHDFYFSYLAPQLFSFVERYFLQDHCQLPALQRRKIWVEWIFCVVGSYCISVRTKIRKKDIDGYNKPGLQFICLFKVNYQPNLNDCNIRLWLIHLRQ